MGAWPLPSYKLELTLLCDVAQVEVLVLNTFGLRGERAVNVHSDRDRGV
jgi:hypothetical protein